jgi:8-oxo-dGTP diphosphatase
MKLEVGVKVLIKNSKGLYLLVQRSEPLLDGTGIKWDIPGGRINPSERLDAALAREVNEEIGVTLQGKLTLLAAQDIMVIDHDLHVVRLTYAISLDKAVALGAEHQNFRWVTQQEALNLNVDPYLREVLENL